MFVGIICACMPAAAHTCHHHLPSYDSLRTILRSRYGYLEKKFRGTYRTSSSVPESISHDVKTSRGVYEGYVNLGTLEHSPTVPAKPIQSLVHHGKPEKFNHGGIHLTYEMQQIFASPATHDRGPTAV